MSRRGRRQAPRIVVTRRLPGAIEARLAELGDTRLNEADRTLDPSALAAALAEAEILVATVTDRLDTAALAGAGERLGLIANFGVGVDHIDLDAAAARGIAVTNTPDVLTEDTADLAMALILGTARRLRAGMRRLERGTWAGWAPTDLLGRRLKGSALGIVGMGRIGQAVALRARAFGMDIHYHNRRRLPRSAEAPLAARYWPDLDAMLGAVDIVSLHCPLTGATHHLISDERLARMKPDACLVNTARGEIVDEGALISALEAGRLAGVGLDVYEAEPRVPEHLLAFDTVFALPHMGSGTEASRREMGERVLQNIESFLAGREPPDTVGPRR